jgi:long-chain acyl-CoA synthetase
MFCYTSGTTGDPKGAKMTHRGFVGIQSLVEYIGLNLVETDTSISYLPYAHIFEQACFVFSLARGFSHGYYSGDPLKLVEDIQTLKPTFFATVPRILNRVHGKIMEGVTTRTKFQ